MNIDELYMNRCLQLAEKGLGFVAPNPIVGAVLVYQNKIIGEGYHQKYGESHAEVNCINSVAAANKNFINKSTLYVSLEPCSHHGKTPPCTDLILKYHIPKVVIGSVDPNTQVDGKGFEKLETNGVKTSYLNPTTVSDFMNRRFFTYHQFKRPYIILKWAQSADGFLGNLTEKVVITNEYSNIETHKWRSQEAAILVGNQTWKVDNPKLTNRNWHGGSPAVFLLKNNSLYTILHKKEENLLPHQSNRQPKKLLPVSEVVDTLYEKQIQSVIVEGGAFTLQQFINANIWDEIRIITNQNLLLKAGVRSPQLNINSEILPYKKFLLQHDAFLFLLNGANPYLQNYWRTERGNL